MTINAPAALLLLLYQLVGEEQGVDPAKLTGTIQNDVLKEYIARGTYIYPPKPSLRLITDIFALLPQGDPALEHDLHLRLPHGRGGRDARAGGRVHAGQRAASTCGRRSASGLAVDDFAPRLSFFFVARTTLLEEVAKFRAARRIWAQVMRDEFGARRSQVADAALPHPDRRRAAHRAAARGQPRPGRRVQGLAAVLGGTQSLHTNSYDEAIALPTEKAARLALRTQQVIAYETDLTATVDPFAGSYAVESMTDEIEAAIRDLMRQVEELGGAVAAIERGFQKTRDRAVRVRRRAGRSTPASGSSSDVNRFTVDIEEPTSPCVSTRRSRNSSAERLATLRGERSATTSIARSRICRRPLKAATTCSTHARRVAGPRHCRRGLRRAAAGLGRLRPARRFLSAGRAGVGCRPGRARGRAEE